MKLLLFLYVVFLFGLATVCLLFPRAVQSYALKSVGMGLTAKLGSLKRYVESGKYIWHLRTVGMGALIMASFLAFGALTNR